MTRLSEDSKKNGQAVSNERLGASDWVKAALSELAESGISGVRVEKLARGLGVTKGSFYWHFKDRDALLKEMLEMWRKRATLAVMERVQKSGSSASARLHGLLSLPFASPRAAEGSDVELAMRIWGRTDPRAHGVLREIDELRMHFIASIFGSLGTEPVAAEAKAMLVYGFMRVGGGLPHKANLEMLIPEMIAALTESTPA